jgi:hypothetical protein
VTVTGVAHPVAEGDTLRLFGTLIDPETVRVTRSFAVPPSGATYTYSVSFLAGLWVLGRLLSHWRLDPTRGLVRRSRPLRPTRWLRRRARDAPSEEAETDA